MRDVPEVSPSGIFEIFVPGVFLLAHIVMILNHVGVRPAPLLGITDSTTLNAAWLVSVVVSFAYLVGMILRAVRVEFADRLSGRLHRIRYPKPEIETLWAHESFPYIASLGEMCFQSAMPRGMLNFYYDVWATFRFDDLSIRWAIDKLTEDGVAGEEEIGKIRVGLTRMRGSFFPDRPSFEQAILQELGDEILDGHREVFLRYGSMWCALGRAAPPGDAASREPAGKATRHQARGHRKTAFFNYCKTIINSEDETLGRQIRLRAALDRYLGLIFYAICVSILMMLPFGVHELASPKDEHRFVFVFLPVLYFLAAFVILYNFRLMRRAEVQRVFFASFKHRETFLGLAADEAAARRHPPAS